MYRMIVVDDEQVEREGITKFIDWPAYDISIVGEAWNGVQGQEIILKEAPDIVLTDIKMPVMNGIEMIRQLKDRLPDCVFIILSGYGDYEYTSQAMQLGIRYYILKPCDEEGLKRVLDQVKHELKEKERERFYENEKYNRDLQRLLSGAKMHFFKELLMGKYVSEEDCNFYQKYCAPGEEGILLLIFRSNEAERGLSCFVVENIFEELVRNDLILLKTEIERDVVFLIRPLNSLKLQAVNERIAEQFQNIFGMELRVAAISGKNLRDVPGLYEKVGKELDGESKYLEEIVKKIAWEKGKQWENFDGLLRECHAVWMIFRLENLALKEMAEAEVLLFTMRYGEDSGYTRMFYCGSEAKLYEEAVKILLDKSGLTLTEEEKRMEKILFLIYEYMDDVRLSMQWLANEILYMNEDYLGRLFKNNMKKRVPEYLNMQRMETARRIWQYDGECSVEQLARFTGYQEDGQYFSKVFKKYFKCTPAEYRKNLKSIFFVEEVGK